LGQLPLLVIALQAFGAAGQLAAVDRALVDFATGLREQIQAEHSAKFTAAGFRARDPRLPSFISIHPPNTLCQLPVGEPNIIEGRFQVYHRLLESPGGDRNDGGIDTVDVSGLRRLSACIPQIAPAFNARSPLPLFPAGCLHGQISAASVTKELNVIKHLLALAVEWELIPVNVAHGVKGPKAPAGRVRYLQPGELRAVLEACPEWLRPIAGLAVSTGMRRGEILGLRWLDVDGKNSRLMLPQTKNGEGRIVYLNELAQQALSVVPVSRDAKPTDRIFHGDGVTPENVSLTFLRSCRSAKIHDFRFHDLRHTAASWMRMKGADIHTVAVLLGHKDLRMAARYQHLSPAHLSDAVKLLDSAFERPD
jgi:site-specific recombinase XerD